MTLSKEKAQKAMVDYIVTLENKRDKVRKNFEDMDLENVKIRDEIEKEICNVETVIKDTITQLYAMTFQ